MKAIDFTHPGGFPLTQERLDYLQQAYTECINAIGMMGGNGPALISGMTRSTTGLTTTVADGWFFYNGEMIKFNAGSFGAIPPGDIVVVVIAPSSTPLTYNDGSTFGAVLEKTASIAVGAFSSLPTPTQFPLSLLQPFQVVFGQNGRESAWNSLIVNTAAADGGVTGTIYYKKNFLTNTLQLRALLTANNAQNFPASPSAIFSLMGTLPTGYIPNNNTYFTGHYFASSLIEDDLNVGWIKHFTCAVNIGGQILINWIRPDISIGGYGIFFNALIPLD